MGKTLVEVQSTLERIALHRARLVERRNAVQGALETAQQAARELFFETNDGGAVRELTAVRIESESELDLITGALTKLDAHESAAQIDLRAATIQDLKGRVQSNRDEAAKINAKVAVHLKKAGQLLEIDLGLEVVCASRDSRGNWTDQPDIHAAGIPQEFRHPYECVPLTYDRSTIFHKPKTRVLLEEARTLEQEVTNLEAGLEADGRLLMPVVTNSDDETLDSGMSKADLIERVTTTQPKPRQIEAGSVEDQFTTFDERLDALKRRAVVGKK